MHVMDASVFSTINGQEWNLSSYSHHRTADALPNIFWFKQAHIGRYQDRLKVIFEDMQLKKRFIITRALKAIRGNKAEHKELRPKAPYVPRYNHLYYLSVPGLVEKRPSVLIGDCILVQEQGAMGGRWFEGHVHVLHQTESGFNSMGCSGPMLQVDNSIFSSN
ncbi:hypothetical protein BYT27DRAFT_7296293 [Phlegmacium glaucopus]|nr:hypothetical protein BYT27DRAFT_7296293 [Phlegmacium glaucopus]